MNAPEDDHKHIWLYVDTVSQPEVGTWLIYRCECGDEKEKR